MGQTVRWRVEGSTREGGEMKERENMTFLFLRSRVNSLVITEYRFMGNPKNKQTPFFCILLLQFASAALTSEILSRSWADINVASGHALSFPIYIRVQCII